MAIYSLNLKSIGRTTHAAGTAGAHLLYIAREGAAPELVSEHMPRDPNAARAWMNRAELGDRKNARVADKVRIALPRELTPEQRMALVRDFARDLTGARVPWFAAIHATGKDAHNPHCHLVIRDRDIDTGKRVVKLSDSPRDRQKAGLEPKAVEWVRALWEGHANSALERAGHEVRIDRRTLEAQGIDRAPTIHIGPQAAHVDRFVERPRSKVRETGQGRSIDYPQIDEGRTRKERHAEIVDLNLERDVRSADFRTREVAKFEKRERDKDLALERRLIKEARDRTREERRMKAAAKAALDELRAARRVETKAIRSTLREEWSERRRALAERHGVERDDLTRNHDRLGSRLKRVFDITGRTRKAQAEERHTLQARHRAERHALVQAHRDRKAGLLHAVEERHAGMQREVRATHYPGLSQMAERHREAERQADRERQAREAERETAQRQHEERLRQVERALKAQKQQRDRGRGLSR